MLQTKIPIGAVIVAWSLSLGASRVDAVPITLVDANSSFSVEPSTQAGAYSWTVNGTEQLFKQWFWYRVGSTGPEKSIDTLPLIFATASDTNGNPGNDQLALRYDNGSFRLDIMYNLTGNLQGLASSKVTEQISITNETKGDLAFHFYEYTDFNLNGTAADDTARRVNTTTIVQTDGSGLLQSTTNVSAVPSHFEIAFVPTTINKLNDASPTTLSDGTSPLGPGDVAYAFQWDKGIAANVGVFAFNKTKTIAPIPEPATFGLMTFGLAGLWLRGWFVRESGMTRRSGRDD